MYIFNFRDDCRAMVAMTSIFDLVNSISRSHSLIYINQICFEIAPVYITTLRCCHYDKLYFQPKKKKNFNHHFREERKKTLTCALLLGERTMLAFFIAHSQSFFILNEWLLILTFFFSKEENIHSRMSRLMRHNTFWR